MNLSKKSAYNNAGRLYSRYKKIDSLLSSLHAELKEMPAEDSTFLLGRIAGIEENRTFLHRKLVEVCAAIKKEIKEIAEYQEENVFLKGYLKGVIEILEMDRKGFDDPISFVLFIYSEDDDLLDKYRLVLSVTGAFSEFQEEGLRYYASSNAEDICSRILELNGESEYLVCVVHEKDSFPSVDTLQKLCFGKYHNVYLHKDRGEENIENIITKMLRDTIV